MTIQQILRVSPRQPIIHAVSVLAEIKKFSAVLRDPENSCEAAQPFVHQQQTESGSGSFEQFGADGVRSHFTQNNFLFLKSKLLALSQ